MSFTTYFHNVSANTKNVDQNKILNNKTTTPADEKITTLEKLSKIKHIIENPKEDSPDVRFNEIKSILGEAECYETIREERWHPAVYCPNCHATNVQTLGHEQQVGPHNFHYLCLICRSRFNDDTKAPFEFNMPSLDVWIQCWFLLGCSNSLEYVAAKLNLDISTVKQMVKELQTIFKIKQPLTHTMSYEDWAKQYSHTLTQRIKEELSNRKAKTELYQGYATGQEKDSAELRRQKNKQNSTKK